MPNERLKSVKHENFAINYSHGLCLVYGGSWTSIYNKLLPICERERDAWKCTYTHFELSELFTQTLEFGQNHERRQSNTNTTYTAMIFTMRNEQIMIFTECISFFPFFIVGASQKVDTSLADGHAQTTKRIEAMILNSISLLHRCVLPWIIVHFGCINTQEFQVFSRFLSLSELFLIPLFTLERSKLSVPIWLQQQQVSLKNKRGN